MENMPMLPEDPVVASLERLAETGDDISEQVYARFAGRCPMSASLMGHMDAYMLGRMLQDVLTLLMTPPEHVDRHYLTFELDSHRAYGVTREMFEPLFTAVRDTVREHFGGGWTADLEQAWQRRIEALCGEIETTGAV